MIPLQSERVALRIGAIGELTGDPELHASAGPLVRARGQDEVACGRAGSSREPRLGNPEQLDAQQLGLPGQQGGP
eukprot:8832145-Lingulodinium_polyedra.AAC.1